MAIWDIAKGERKIDIVRGDDWMGVYENNELIYEGHSIDESTLLDLLRIKHEVVYADLNWLDSQGRLPIKLEDVEIENAENN